MGFGVTGRTGWTEGAAEPRTKPAGCDPATLRGRFSPTVRDQGVAGSNPVFPTVRWPRFCWRNPQNRGSRFGPHRSSAPPAHLRGVDRQLQDFRDRCLGRLDVEPVKRVAPVVEVEVAVDLSRDRRRRVPEDSLDDRQRSAGLEEQSGRRVPQIVEPDASSLRRGPALEPARAVPGVGGGRLLLVTAPTALMGPTVDQSGAVEG